MIYVDTTLQASRVVDLQGLAEHGLTLLLPKLKEDTIYNKLLQLDPKKGAGADQIPPKFIIFVLKSLQSLCILFIIDFSPLVYSQLTENVKRGSY